MLNLIRLILLCMITIYAVVVSAGVYMPGGDLLSISAITVLGAAGLGYIHRKSEDV